MEFLAKQGIPWEVFKAARKPISEAHNRQETPLFAKSIERHALRNSNSAGVANAANLYRRTKMLKEIDHENGTQQAAFETISAHKEGGVLFAEIAAPPMNLLGPELVRDLVSLIQQTEADDSIHVLVFKSADPDYFISHVDVTRIAEYGELAKQS